LSAARRHGQIRGGVRREAGSPEARAPGPYVCNLVDVPLAGPMRRRPRTGRLRVLRRVGSAAGRLTTSDASDVGGLRTAYRPYIERLWCNLVPRIRRAERAQRGVRALGLGFGLRQRHESRQRRRSRGTTARSARDRNDVATPSVMYAPAPGLLRRRLPRRTFRSPRRSSGGAREVGRVGGDDGAWRRVVEVERLSCASEPRRPGTGPARIGERKTAGYRRLYDHNPASKSIVHWPWTSGGLERTTTPMSMARLVPDATTRRDICCFPAASPAETRCMLSERLTRADWL